MAIQNSPFHSGGNSPGVSREVHWANELTRAREPGPKAEAQYHIDPTFGLSTRAVHAGTYEDPITGAVGTPIFNTTTFLLQQSSYAAFEEGTIRDVPIYTRYGNPSQWAVQEKMAALEGAESALVLASGMAAISTTLLALTNRGGHVITAYDIYGGSYNFMRQNMQQLGRTVSFVDPTDIDAVCRAIRPETQVLFFETLSNPLLKPAPIDKLAEMARANKSLLVVDNTFLSPVFLRPLEFGAHLVIHSATKYINGHSDLTAGVLAGRRKYVDMIYHEMLKLGGILSPHGCALLERGLKTLPLRMRAHDANARALVEYLDQHPKVMCVHHPYSRHYRYSDGCHLLGAGCTGVVSFEVCGGDEAALSLLHHLRLPRVATSLGGIESLVSLPFNTSHSSLTAAQRQRIGIMPGLVRYSVGIEDAGDLTGDLTQAFSHLI